MTKKGTLLLFSSLLLPSVWLHGSWDAHASIPTCTDEIEVNYPPMLRGDLSACRAPSDPKPEATIEVKKFAANLAGTWTLSSRTQRGITVEGKSRIMFGVEPTKAGATGSALVLDCIDAGCEQTRIRTAFSVTLAEVKNRVVLTRRDDVMAASTAPKGDPSQSTEWRFFLQSNVYVAVDGATGREGQERRWDRMVMTEKTLSYVSCRYGQVDRYVKTSPKSLLDGTPVRDLLKLNVLGRRLP